MQQQPTIVGGKRFSTVTINASSGAVVSLGTLAAALVTEKVEQERIIGVEVMAYNDDFATTATARPACLVGSESMANGDPVGAGETWYESGNLAALNEIFVRNTADAANANAQIRVDLAPHNLQ